MQDASNINVKEVILTGLNFKENNFFALNLNSKRVMETAEKISSVYFKILFVLCTFETGQTISTDYLNKFTTHEFEAIEILNFWRENGFISYKEVNDFDTTNMAKLDINPIILVNDICEVLETQASFRDFIKKSQNIFGKILNPIELQVIYKLYSIYKIDEKLLIAIMEVCREENHNSVGYFEKVAVDLYKNGIFTYEQYEKNYEEKKKITELEPKIREIFDMGNKKFTSKERGTVKKWLVEYNYDLNIIQNAYDICIQRLGKYQFNYISKIIFNWNQTGCHTLNDIASMNDNSNYNYNNIKSESSSFDLEDFFEKAVRLGMQKE